MDGTHVDCRSCKHYYVTWDRRFPHGCRAAGFKSALLPSLEVFTASCTPCLSFEKKVPRQKRDTG
jgi:hypothetical protein